MTTAPLTGPLDGPLSGPVYRPGNGPLTSRYLQVDGRTVHYRHVGRGEPVVLLHASPRSSQALLPLMRTAPDGLSSFAIDLPGFGRSTPLSDARSIEAFADALATTLTALGLPRVRLYGTHTGAAVAVALAVRHPERVERLVLDGLSVFTATREVDLTRDVDDYLPVLEPDPDGLHMTWAWNRVRDQALFFPWNARRSDARLWRPLPSPDTLQAATLDLLVASDYRSAYSAAMRTDGAAWVARLRVPTRVGAREDDVLRTHLELLCDVPAGVTVAPFASDPATWASQVWAALQGGAALAPSLATAPEAADERWSATTLTDTHRGPAGARLHWRGCRDGPGRPLIWLHDSPGSARVLDAGLGRCVGHRPVFACDIPGHGESDVAPGDDLAALLDALHEGIDRLDVPEAELRGVGAGGWLAHWLALRAPQRWSLTHPLPRRGPMPAPPHATARADGGHLNAAWLDARDAAILGRWWQRDPSERHDFGDALNLRAIHREAVERLFESPQAAVSRRSIADRAADLDRGLTAPTSSRSPTRPRSRSTGRTP